MSPVPILFLIFNRPETTAKVFAQIREVRPRKLYVAADGPRENVKGEADRCARSRTIALNIDWPCEVQTLFRKTNLGCMKAVSSAISWFFTCESEGIVLEDDCLPDQTFFSYCENMLAYYRNHARIMHISGDNFQNGRTRGNASYYFSRYNHVWGWASWRRAWGLFEPSVLSFPDFVNTPGFNNIFARKDVREYWRRQFQLLHKGEINTWDYYWTYVIWLNDGLCVIPNQNLVSNIGFQGDSTHTGNPRDRLANMPCVPLKTIFHPRTVSVCLEADSFSFDLLYSRSMVQRFKRKCRGLLQ